MHAATKYSLFATLLFLGATLKTTSQNTADSPKNQFEITHDNDFLVITDRYYTFGLSLKYTRFLDHGLFNMAQEQLSFKLLQQAYTPSNVETFESNEMDRPYAGFLGLETGWSVVKSNSFYKTELLLGLVGPSSGVGNFQQWYHDNIVKYKTPTWANELPNQFQANISLQYAKEWRLSPNPFGVLLAVTPSAAVGSKDVYLQPEVTSFFGRRNPMEETMAYEQINSLEKELYFSIGMAYRYVAENAFLDANKISENVFLFNFQFHHRFQSNEYRVGVHYNTQEARNLRDHKYVSLGYAKSF